MLIAVRSNIYEDAAYKKIRPIKTLQKNAMRSIAEQRKSNATRKEEPWIWFISEQSRKYIEGIFSEIKTCFSKRYMQSLASYHN